MPEPDVSAAGKESLAKRLFLFAVGGAIAGFVTAPLLIATELAVELATNRGMPLMELLDFYSPLGEPFWTFFISRLGVFAGSPLGGVLYGVLIGVFSRGRRSAIQVLKISMWSGSILASLAMLSVFFNRDIKLLFLVLAYFVIGAAFGGATAYFAGIADKVLRKFNPQSAAETTREPH